MERQNCLQHTRHCISDRYVVYGSSDWHNCLSGTRLWQVGSLARFHKVLISGAWMTWQETRHFSNYRSIFRIAWAPDFFARVFIGYLVYDMVVMIWYYKELQDPTAILHHFIFLLAATYVVAHSIMAYPFSWLAFTEVSTPFLNIRYQASVHHT